ncbi:MAG: flagellar biosynthesis anti-sigma factor FlgM [Proteobacteria bacterium]|nr:flagellar biosynthesis anti-sigma factor FlgM [Pseudomonadota bacterium]
MSVKNVTGQAANQIPANKIGESSGAKASKQVVGPSNGIVGAQSPNSGAKSVDVNVSDKAKTRAAEQKLAKEIAMKSPEVREDKVAAIKAQIDAGTYKVDSQKIADGMMREAVMEHLTKEGSN